MSLTINQIKGAREFCIGEEFESGPRDEAIDTLLAWVGQAEVVFNKLLRESEFIPDNLVEHINALLTELD
jgi:hypothetical protein